MKRITILLFSILFLVSCDNRYFTGKQVFRFENTTDRDICVKGSDDGTITVPKNQTASIESRPDTVFSIDNYYRCTLTFTTHGRHIIADKTPSHITVRNDSNKIIVLQEINGNIGSYAELQTIAASTSTTIDKVKISIEIPAGGSSSYDLYTNCATYKTYYKDSGKTLDSLEWLTFN